MKNLLLPALGLVLLLATPVLAAGHFYEISSPQHEQTFSYGSERSRQWMQRGSHLELAIHFTNDPYVDRTEPRLYDDFVFAFPNVTLGPDGKTFSYHPAHGRPVAVAMKSPGLFGDEIRLLPSSFLLVDKPHGWLTLTLVATDVPAMADSD